MRTKPTNFEAAKLVMGLGEQITADQIIGRMMDLGRKEIPTKKAISVKFRTDPDIEVLKSGRSATLFIRLK
jgi:hypothetical protein|tara:strand:- start:16112 stop:16324 length:213 start_codon:yes stop_codon:yes gene_type:complete